MDRGGRRGRVSGMLPLLALQTVSEYCRLDRKPLVTAGLIATNTLIYLRPEFLDPILPTLDEVWFNPYLIVKNRDLKRFLFSAFYHMSEPHLVYNMLSLLWKGIQLEQSMGSVEFASMIAALLSMSQGITLLLAKSLLLFFDYDRAYYREYAVGFSGVLFAMKVVLNSQSDNYTFVHGFLVPAHQAAWLELILIQMLVPGVSFLGHLGGILAGLLYLRFKRSYAGPALLTRIIRGFTNILHWPSKVIQGLLQSRRRRTFGRGNTGRGHQIDSTPGLWRCRACTFDNSGWLSVCEMCGTGRDGSFESANQAEDLSFEELRRRRLQRFGR